MKANKAALAIALTAGCACAIVYVYAYGGILSNPSLPGFGMTLLSGVILATGVFLGRGRKKPEWQSRFLLLCASLLSLSYSLFGSRTMRLLNLPVLLALNAQALFALSGLNAQPPLSPAGVREGFRRFFHAPVAHWGAPFQALAGLRKQRRLPGLWLGAAVTLPLVLLVLLLLCSADAVFNARFSGLAQSLQRLNFGSFLWKALKTAVLSLFLFSFLYALSQPRHEMAAAQARSLPDATFGMLLSALCAVYALFVYVQFRYLFGGAETAVLQGGYAQYARSGFFELVAVSLLNLLVLSLTLTLCSPTRPLRALCALLTLLTAVILFSAFWRMRLYIRAFGLSTLRLLTLWAMGAIAAALALLLCRLLYPALRVFPLLTALLIAGWIALNYINVDRTIARYNVRAFEQGQMERFDADYLCSLSADVLPELRGTACYDDVLRALKAEESSWFCRDLSALHLPH